MKTMVGTRRRKTEIDNGDSGHPEEEGEKTDQVDDADI